MYKRQVYGTTPTWAINALEVVLCVILSLWLASRMSRGVKLSVHPLLLACVAVLLVFGWAMAINPHFQHTGEYRFSPIPPSFPKVPGTVDELTSCLAMLRVTCLLGAICFAVSYTHLDVYKRQVIAATESSLDPLSTITISLFG